jgi:hypothetical protein
MRRMHLGIALGILTAVQPLLPQTGVPTGTTDRWKRLEFLTGKWTGSGSGKPGGALAGGCEFSFELDRSILIRRNRAETGPGQIHEDLMVIYPQPATADFRARYFDNEGHIIDYTVHFPEGERSGDPDLRSGVPDLRSGGPELRSGDPDLRSAVFESDSSGGGPRFRLVYSMSADSVLTTEFLIAPPGGEFTSYLRGESRKE